MACQAWAGQIVTATGISFCQKGEEAIAREKALDRAKRNAVQQVLGSHIQSMTLVKNFTLQEDRIINRSSGYIKNVNVISEKITLESAILELKIEAEVESADIKNDVQRFQEILSWQKNPRITIFIQPETPIDCMPQAQTAKAVFTEKLVKSGFKVYRYSENSLEKVGLVLGISLGRSVTQTEYQGMSISANEVGLSVNIYRPGDGHVLASADAVRTIPGENRLAVLNEGTTSCVTKMWQDLKNKLMRQYEKELFHERDLHVTMINVPSYAAALSIQEKLKNHIAGVRECALLKFGAKKTDYTLRFQGRPEHFINELDMAYFRNTGLNTQLKSLEENNITFSMKN